MNQNESFDSVQYCVVTFVCERLGTRWRASMTSTCRSVSNSATKAKRGACCGKKKTTLARVKVRVSYRSSDSKLWALRKVTSASAADRVDVEEEMPTPVEDTGVVEDEVVMATVGKGCEMDRLRPSRSAFGVRVLLLLLPLWFVGGRLPFAVCLARNEPGLLHTGTSSGSVSTVRPPLLLLVWWDDWEVGLSVSLLFDTRGGGREGGPLGI